jgi:hypothetical protein
MTEEEHKAKKRWKVVGYNTLALVIYTLLFKLIEGGVFLDCFVVGIHFLACLIISIGIKKWEWLLSAFIVLAIGFSTCVTYLTMPNMH